MNLKGNTILITGGSSGIGLTLATRLFHDNTVIICGRSQQKLDDAKKLLPNIHIVRCDLASGRERTNLFEYLQAHHPTIDVLINNAAIVHKVDFRSEEGMIEKAEAEVNTNFMAPIALSKLFLSQATQPLAIINITTGLVYAPRAVYPIYNATKAALHSFTRVLRYQLRNTNIRVVEVLMPVVDTPWHRGSPPRMAISPEKAVDEMLLQLKKGRLEIMVGAVKMLHLISRLSPALAFRLVNRIE